MKFILRFIAVVVMLIALVFFLGYMAATVGLWQLNAPTISGLTQAFTTVDDFLQKADPILDKTAALLGEVAILEDEISDGESHTVAGVYEQLNTLRQNAQTYERTLATTIPQIPAYLNLMWIGVTLVLLWLALAQAALIYLAAKVFKRGWLRQAPPSPAIPAMTAEPAA